MYREFYGLNQKPFSILPDPHYLYWGHAHSLAYSMLEYGVMNRAGFTVITGEIGCGKTTLIRHLLDRLDEDFTVGLVSNIQDGDLLQWVLMAFGQPYEGKSHVGLHDELQQFLIREYAEGRRTILIVDEAQNLGPKLLEQLRLLSNINADNDQLLQLILVGQPQLKELLQAPELIQFAQRIASDFHLSPLSADDVEAYIKHRLHIAGRDLPLFTREACQRLYEASRGIPRLINILADTALVYGFARMSPEIDADIVNEVIRDKQTHGIFGISAPKGFEDAKVSLSHATPAPAVIPAAAPVASVAAPVAAPAPAPVAPAPVAVPPVDTASVASSVPPAAASVDEAPAESDEADATSELVIHDKELARQIFKRLRANR